MKLSKSELKEIIREVIQEEKQLNELGFTPDPDVGKNYWVSPKREKKPNVMMSYQKYSSPEARNIAEGKLKQYVKDLRQLEYRLVKDWMSAAKAGVIDFFDLIRVFNTGDVQRAHIYEIKFLHGLLTRDGIVNRFRSYFKGKKGKRRN